MAPCSFNVRSDIPSLVEANEKPDGGVVVAYDGWAGSSAKRFATVKKPDGGVVVAYDAWAGSSAKRFARVKCDVTDGRHNCTFADLVELLTRRDNHTYEIISGETPARLFLEVEWPDDGQVKAADPLTTLLSALDVYCYGSTVFAKRVVLSCLRPNSKKRSFRVVFPNAVFRSVSVDMKIFVLGFVRWLLEEHESGVGASLTYEKTLKNGTTVATTVVDTAVYTSNTHVRMLGQSKKSDETRTPMSMQDDNAAATDAMVHHPRWVRANAEASAEIDSVMEKQRPADCAYPALPPRRDCGLVWKTTSKSGGGGGGGGNELVWQSRMRGQSLTVRSAVDVANAIDGRLLREVDYTRLFVPILASLCTSGLSDDFLLAWIATTDAMKARRRLDLCRDMHSSDTVECDAAMRFLNRVYANVTDARMDARVRRPLLVPIEPTVDGGWVPVEAGDGLRLLVQRLCSQDRKFVGTRNEIRRTYVVSGKTGAGKTKAVLEFNVDWLKRGVYEAVTYLGPRRVLVESVAQRVEQLEAERKGVHDRSNICAVTVDRIYHDAPPPTRNDDPTANDKHVVKRRRTGVFTAACVNSVHKTPETNDVVIVDELAQMLRTFKGDSTTLDCGANDKCITDSIAARMRNARVVFILEAALPRDLLHACFELRKGEDVPLRSYFDGLEGDAKRWKSWLLEQKRCPDTTPMVNPKTKEVYRLARPIKLAVYDPRVKTAIFNRLEEFPNLDDLKADLLKCAIERKRAVVYVSSSKTGVQLTNMLFANHKAAVAPKVLTASAETMAAMGLEKMMNEMKTCRFLITSNVLGGGYSFEVPDVFDVAYAVFEFSINTPPLADMVHACGMVRCVGEKVLKYTVVSHPYAVPKQVECLETLATLEPMRKTQRDYRVNDLHESRRHCSNVAYARPCVRESLILTLSHTDAAQIVYRRPELVVCPPGDSVERRRTAKAAGYLNGKYHSLLQRLPPKVVVAGYVTGKGKARLIPNIESTRDDFCLSPSTPLMPLEDGGGIITDRVVARNAKKKRKLATTAAAAAGLPGAKKQRQSPA